MKRENVLRIFPIAWLFFFLFWHGSLAHATLMDSDPAPNSRLKTAPSAVTLSFNERLEKSLYFIRVYDQHGYQVTDKAAEMSQDQHQIRLGLPALKDGIYTVTYHVISADGHPVDGSYVFSIGEYSREEAAPADGPTFDESPSRNIAYYLIRFFYYFSLLSLSGWVIWGTFYPKRSEAVVSRFSYWLRRLLHFYLVMVLAYGLVQMAGLLSGTGLKGLPSLLQTPFGLSWLSSLLLALAGYMVLQRAGWLDVMWALSVLLTEGISGHAITLVPSILSVLVDTFHLVMASVWAGGILYILLFWKMDAENVQKFLPTFSRAALISLVAMIVTGTILTLAFVPRIQDLFATAWGITLIVKIALVFLVIVIAGIIRSKMKKKDAARIKGWIKYDFCVMILIVAVVGVLTNLKIPLPPNQPLFWHEMGESIHLTMEITPNAPGDNQIDVKLLVTRKDLKIKRAQLLLKYEGRTQIAPIHVPLEFKQVTEWNEYQYTSSGPYLPFRGDWTAEIRILDSNDDETVYTKAFTVY